MLKHSRYLGKKETLLLVVTNSTHKLHTHKNENLELKIKIKKQKTKTK